MKHHLQKRAQEVLPPLSFLFFFFFFLSFSFSYSKLPSQSYETVIFLLIVTSSSPLHCLLWLFLIICSNMLDFELDCQYLLLSITYIVTLLSFLVSVLIFHFFFLVVYFIHHLVVNLTLLVGKKEFHIYFRMRTKHSLNYKTL